MDTVLNHVDSIQLSFHIIFTLSSNIVASSSLIGASMSFMSSSITPWTRGFEINQLIPPGGPTAFHEPTWDTQVTKWRRWASRHFNWLICIYIYILNDICGQNLWMECPNSHPNRWKYNVLFIICIYLWMIMIAVSFLFNASIAYKWWFLSWAKTYEPTGQLGNLPLTICGSKWKNICHGS